MSNPIITENALAGTTAWIPNANATTQTIAGYCDKTSYNPGDTVSMYVSTQVASTAYSVTIYRLGWYGGMGAAQKNQTTGRTGQAQGYWDGATLHNDTNQIFNSTTHNLEAGWTLTDTWVIPGGAVTGVYLAEFLDANGMQSYCTFVVKGNTSADYLYIQSDTTSAAYNNWGGYSLYTNPRTDVQVSFNKPNARGIGTGNLFFYDLQFIRWIERQGYSLSYISDIDYHVSPVQLLTYKALLFGAHDEYWTKSMRDAVEAAIASNIGAAFMGANASYWQCRLDNDNAGNANRTVTCYKVTTAANNLSLDPQYGVNNAIVTSNWRDAVINRPENTMIGIMFWDFTSGSNGAWTTDASMDTTYTAGSGLVANTSYGTDLAGYEWDNIQSGSPAGLKTIGTTAMTGNSHGASNSNTTWYRAPSGALVFASGSVAWSWSLDMYRYTGHAPGFVNAVIPGMQVLFTNIMGALKGPVYGNIGR